MTKRFLALFIATLMLAAIPVYAEDPPVDGETPIVPTETAPVQPTPPTGENTVIIDDMLASPDYQIPDSFPNSVTGERFDGGATLVDYVVTGSKHFYTIVTREEETLYLILDFDKDENNVYFLTEVSQEALVADEDGEQEPQGGGLFGSQSSEPPEDEPQSDQEPAETEGGFPTTLVLMLLVVGGVFGVGYYNKILKPKRKKQQAAETEGLDDGEDPEPDFMNDEFEYEE